MSCPAVHRVLIDGRALTDWNAFHDVFASKLGFPSYYGRNLDAWHDCVYSLAAESTCLRIAPGDAIIIEVAGYQELKARQPKIAEFLFEGCAFVNFTLDEARKEGELGDRLGAIAISAYERSEGWNDGR